MVSIFQGTNCPIHLLEINDIQSTISQIKVWKIVGPLGAIDGTHVCARVPAKIAAAFRGRKHYTSQNVLAVVDFDLKFTYVLAGWEGSPHDALILADAIERDDGLRVPQGNFNKKNW